MNTLIASLDELKAQQKKLSARAIDLKLQLHDLAEELPVNWEQIPAVAQRAFEAFKELAALKAKIAKSGDS